MNFEEFSQRVESIKVRLYRTAYLYLGSEADALEAVDEAVYQALRALKKLRHPEFFETWITRILLNECHRELRRRKRILGEDSLPDDAVAEDYDAFHLREAVEKLPEKLRQVIILRFFGGYTIEETAQCLKIPRGTVTIRQSKALSLLRLDLGKEENV